MAQYFDMNIKSKVMRTIPRILLALTLTVFLSSCYNAIEQQLYHGNYDEVIHSSLQKMNKSRNRDDYLALAEKAYNKVLEDDKSRIAALKARNNDNSNWGNIYYLYKQMAKRQRAINPYLPITYANGQSANFEIFNYDQVIEEARENAANYHYERAKYFLDQPYKQTARDAYYELNKINDFYGAYKDRYELQRIAKDKGTNHVLLTIKSAYNVQLPPGFIQQVMQYDYERRMDNWSQLYRTWSDSSAYDLGIEVTVERIEISPEHITEVHHHEQKKIEDGVQPLLDSEGNFVTDTSGNIIQIPKHKTVECHVTEWHQSKSARIFSSFKIYDNRLERLVVHQPLEDNVAFDNHYAQANGYLDILNDHLQDLIHHHHPKPFPNNYDMIMQTTENLKQHIARNIGRHDEVLAGL